MSTVDWPKRPDASPAGGFLIQRRGGSRNFEVVIAWPDGGLAYFARDNGAVPARWIGPTIFGAGRCLGASSPRDAIGPPGTTSAPLTVASEPSAADFTHWHAADLDGAVGSLHDSTVTLTGPMGTAFYLHDDYPNFSSERFTPRLAATGMVEIKGGVGNTFLLTFGTPIKDPYVLIGSLSSVLTFPAGTVATKLSGGPAFTASGNVVRMAGTDIAAAQSDVPLGLTDANGTVRLEGTFSALSFSLVPVSADVPQDGVFLQIGGTEP